MLDRNGLLREDVRKVFVRWTCRSAMQQGWQPDDTYPPDVRVLREHIGHNVRDSVTGEEFYIPPQSEVRVVVVVVPREVD